MKAKKTGDYEKLVHFHISRFINDLGTFNNNEFAINYDDNSGELELEMENEDLCRDWFFVSFNISP